MLSKRFVKIISIVIIQAFLVLDFAWAMGPDARFFDAGAQEYLAPTLTINSAPIQATLQNMMAREKSLQDVIDFGKEEKTEFFAGLSKEEKIKQLEQWMAASFEGGGPKGAYEAGIGQLFMESWMHLKNQGKEDVTGFDVIGGNSAGAINALFFSLAIMYDPTFVKYNEITWVKHLNLKNLLEPGQNYNPKNAVFSSQIIDRAIKAIEQKLEECKNNDKTLSYAPEEIRVVFSVTNLSGTPYWDEVKNLLDGKKGIRYDHQGKIHFTIKKKDRYSPETMEMLTLMMKVAVASASIPIVFEARKIAQSVRAYPGSILANMAVKAGKWLTEKITSIFVDGMLVDNKAIKTVAKLARKKDIEEGMLNSNLRNRLQVAISPNVIDDTEGERFDKQDIPSVAMKSLSAVMAQVLYQNEKIDEINKKNTLITHFIQDIQKQAEKVKRYKWSKKRLKQEIDELLFGSSYSLIKRKSENRAKRHILKETGKEVEYEATKDEVAWYIKRNKERVIRQRLLANGIITEAQLNSQDERDKLFIDYLALFTFVEECGRDLRGREEVYVHQIAPTKHPLASDLLLGFLSEDVRQADFNQGYEDARLALEALLGVDLSGLRRQESVQQTEGYQFAYSNVSLTERKEIVNMLIARAKLIVKTILSKKHSSLVGKIFAQPGIVGRNILLSGALIFVKKMLAKQFHIPQDEKNAKARRVESLKLNMRNNILYKENELYNLKETKARLEQIANSKKPVAVIVGSDLETSFEAMSVISRYRKDITILKAPHGETPGQALRTSYTKGKETIDLHKSTQYNRDVILKTFILNSGILISTKKMLDKYSRIGGNYKITELGEKAEAEWATIINNKEHIIILGETPEQLKPILKDKDVLEIETAKHRKALNRKIPFVGRNVWEKYFGKDKQAKTRNLLDLRYVPSFGGYKQPLMMHNNLVNIAI
ncbi:MAG: patatin-like phospholipase family protein [PVC group bacterium]|nr:patatin-like phospholipase family protein [PVC group bacterium]